MAADFVPFDATPQDIQARSVLRPGIPDSMRGSLMAWIRSQIVYSTGEARLDVLNRMANTLDMDLGLSMRTFINGSAAMDMMNRFDQTTILKITHFLVQQTGHPAIASAVVLENVLAEGRSKWMVGSLHTGAPGLLQRVPEGVQQAAEALIADGGSAGQLLALAWSDVHDFQPRDSAAYSNAVKAVEAAALPVMGLDTGSETLGNVIRSIEGNRAGPEPTWRLPFLREHHAAPSREVLAGMLKSLWRGQRDRHGSGAFEGVTHEEALAAVFMAVTLVGWFSEGLVAERTDVEMYG